MGGIPETGIEIDIGKGAIFTFYKFLRVFKTLVHNPLMRRATENSEEFPLESGQTPAREVCELLHIHVAQEILIHEFAQV